MKLILAIGAGGALGALSRYYLSGAINRMLGDGFPFGIFAVNIIGSFLMGLLVATLGERASFTPELRGLLAIGFLGSFTTFSTYSLDIVDLFQRGEWLSGGFYALGSLILAVVGLIGGMLLGRALV